MASIPRKFQKGMDDAKEETELQQLYNELDTVREQLVLTPCAVLLPLLLTVLRVACMPGA